MSGWHELADELHTEWEGYGHKAKPGSASIRTRDRAHTIGLQIGTNREGQPTLTLYINHGREHMKAKVLLTDFTQALNTASKEQQ